MTTQYIKIVVDPSGDNYVVDDELLTGAIIDRKVNTPSSFQFQVHNPDGANIGLYELDDKVDFYVDTGTTPTTKIMTGTIMDIDLTRDKYGGNTLTIRGEDYLTVLAERLARATFPGAVDVSTILINLLTEFASGEYTTTNVHTSGVTVNNFTVGAETTLLALLRRLADLPGSSYDFYLDGDNDLVWHPRASASWDSGVTLSGSNIRRMTVNRSTRDKKTFIKLTGAQTPVEEATSRQSTVTDSVTLEDNYYADDFIAQHNNLMAVEVYIQKIGTPAADLTGRIAAATYGV